MVNAALVKKLPPEGSLNQTQTGARSEGIGSTRRPRISTQLRLHTGNAAGSICLGVRGVSHLWDAARQHAVINGIFRLSNCDIFVTKKIP
jgi:hypothetical protein